jgi:hypothetical protein
MRSAAANIRIGAPDVSVNLMSDMIDAGQPQLCEHNAGATRGTLVATRRCEGRSARDQRTGGPSFVKSSVACLRTDFGREVLAILGPSE